jgi:3-dehydroquinate dehydratase
MRYSVSKMKSPIIIGVVREKTVKDAICAIKNCKLQGATGIDLHLSCLKPEYQTVAEIRNIVDSCSLPLIALNYNQYCDRTGAGFDEEARLELLVKAVEAGADAIDMQGYSFDLPSKSKFDENFKNEKYSFIKNNPHEVVVNPKIIEKQKAFIEHIHTLGAEVMISNHPGVYMNTEQVLDWVHFMEERNPDVIKIVLVAHNEEELAESFRTMVKLAQGKTPIAMHCSGYGTKLSRIINPILGSHIAFCVDRYRPYDDINQLDINTMRTIIDNVYKLL